MVRIQKWMLLVTIAALSAVAFAAPLANDSKVVSLRFEKGAAIAGTVLDEGVYKVRVDRTGNDAEVTVMRGSKQVAKTKGTFVELKNFNVGNAVGYDHQNNVVRLEAGALKGAVTLTASSSATGAAN